VKKKQVEISAAKRNTFKPNYDLLKEFAPLDSYKKAYTPKEIASESFKKKTNQLFSKKPRKVKNSPKEAKEDTETSEEEQEVTIRDFKKHKKMNQVDVKAGDIVPADSVVGEAIVPAVEFVHAADAAEATEVADAADAAIETKVDQAAKVTEGTEAAIEAEVDEAAKGAEAADAAIETKVDEAADAAIETKVDEAAEAAIEAEVDQAADAVIETKVDEAAEAAKETEVDQAAKVTKVDEAAEAAKETEVDQAAKVTEVDEAAEAAKETEVEAEVDQAAEVAKAVEFIERAEASIAQAPEMAQAAINEYAQAAEIAKAADVAKVTEVAEAADTANETDVQADEVAKVAEDANEAEADATQAAEVAKAAEDANEAEADATQATKETEADQIVRDAKAVCNAADMVAANLDTQPETQDFGDESIIYDALGCRQTHLYNPDEVEPVQDAKFYIDKAMKCENDIGSSVVAIEASVNHIKRVAEVAFNATIIREVNESITLIEIAINNINIECEHFEGTLGTAEMCYSNACETDGVFDTAPARNSIEHIRKTIEESKVIKQQAMEALQTTKACLGRFVQAGVEMAVGSVLVRAEIAQDPDETQIEAAAEAAAEAVASGEAAASFEAAVSGEALASFESLFEDEPVASVGAADAAFNAAIGAVRGSDEEEEPRTQEEEPLASVGAADAASNAAIGAVDGSDEEEEPRTQEEEDVPRTQEEDETQTKPKADKKRKRGQSLSWKKQGSHSPKPIDNLIKYIVEVCGFKLNGINGNEIWHATKTWASNIKSLLDVWFNKQKGTSFTQEEKQEFEKLFQFITGKSYADAVKNTLKMDQTKEMNLVYLLIICQCKTSVNLSINVKATGVNGTALITVCTSPKEGNAESSLGFKWKDGILTKTNTVKGAPQPEHIETKTMDEDTNFIHRGKMTVNYKAE